MYYSTSPLIHELEAEGDYRHALIERFLAVERRGWQRKWASTRLAHGFKLVATGIKPESPRVLPPERTQAGRLVPEPVTGRPDPSPFAGLQHWPPV